MKVLIPFSYFHPEQCAGLFIVDDMTAEGAQQGIETLITVPTPTRNVPRNAVWSRDEALCEGKVRVHRFRMYGEGKNPVLRALRYVLCEVVQMHYMLWKEYDVAFIDSTPPIQGLKLPNIEWNRIGQERRTALEDWYVGVESDLQEFRQDNCHFRGY